MKPSPPRWARHFFHWYCHPAYYEDLQGDLEELYDERLRQAGIRQAKWKYVRDVLLLFHPTIIRPVHSYSILIQPPMFRNYLKVSFRSLWRHKSYALLNIFGLATGITAAIVLFLIVRYERSFDTFHPQHQQVYRIGESTTKNGGEASYLQTRPPAVPTLIEEMPEVVSGTRFFAPNHIRLRYQDQVVNPLVHYVDSGFVDVFDFGLLSGDLRQTLTTANHIALTESVASKLFGREEAVGKTLEVINSEQRFVVGAVLPDPPEYSSLQFTALLPWTNTPEWLAMNQSGGWDNTFMVGYIKLTEQAAFPSLAEKLIDFKNRHFVGNHLDEVEMMLLPLAELRAYETDNRAIMVLLSIIAVIILLIASINFTNLATARSLLRMREIGVRKALGSLRSQLIVQFLTESLVTCGLALLMGILLVHIALPWFNNYFDAALTFRYWQNLPLLGMLLGLGLLTGLLAGAYPALFVSRQKPVTSLKGQGKHRLSGRLFQHGLIVVQYAVSILLIAGTLIIWRQIHFMKSQDLKFDQKNVVAFSLWYENYDFQSEDQAKSAIQTMINRLNNESVISAITFADRMPGQYRYNYTDFYDSESPNQQPVNLRQTTVGDNYFETLGMDLVSGRTFSGELYSDSSAIIINESAMRELGWQDVQDKYVVNSEGVRFPVVGVVRDYHYESLQQRIQPMVHYYYPGDEYYYGEIAVRLQPGRTIEGLQVLEEVYESLEPFEPFTYHFLDEKFDTMYRAQERLGLTATLFAGIAVVLASLGLLGLAAFATRQRRKEVGVRKVLGASVLQIIVLLSRNFALLVLLAFLVACPLVYYAADQFLQDFAYRVPIRIDIFVIAGIAAILIAGFSVSLQAFRAASMNPVHSLRDE
uniref:ABC transporter permease n=1 Tax=Roseihalotalea indica TaxID=2867963 RepID=A0AA49GTY6_9BACT|nr:ABC transporter permease [Tunicatimonas sp. TK19036]